MSVRLPRPGPYAVSPAPLVPGRFRIVDGKGLPIAYMGNDVATGRLLASSLELEVALIDAVARWIEGVDPRSAQGEKTLHSVRLALGKARGEEVGAVTMEPRETVDV